MPETLGKPSGLAVLFQTVVHGGYCIGCGACTFGLENGPIRMRLDEFGRFQPEATYTADEMLVSPSPLSVCPFSAEALNEDEIGGVLYGNYCRYDSRIGYYLANYAGYVSEGGFRDEGSSGGMATWILCELLRRGLVDAVLHVKPHDPTVDDGRLFTFDVSTTVDHVKAGAKSRYYPIEMSEVLRFVRQNPHRYAIVGLPCFIKAIRLLSNEDPIFRSRIIFCLALVCGHLKSTAFADFFAWQCGIQPSNLRAIDFRRKMIDRKSWDYGVEVTGLDNGELVSRVARVADLYGTDWGLGFFKYNACDYCDDVVGETSDVSVGDAWLPQYVPDSEGTNIVTIRHPTIHLLIKEGLADRRLVLEEIDAGTVALSQSGGFHHRRDGLAYRLYLADRKGQWRPKKRVAPDPNRRNWLFRRIHKFRMQLARQSHIAWAKAIEKDDFTLFVRLTKPVVRRYRACYKPPLWLRLTIKFRVVLAHARGLLRHATRSTINVMTVWQARIGGLRPPRATKGTEPTE